MTDWVKYLAKDWGHWMRKADRKGMGLSGTLGRIQEQGLDGAAIRGHIDTVPIVEFPLDVKKFHLAWKKLEPQFQNIIFLDFRIININHKDKFKALGLKKDAYYRRRRKSLDAIARSMALG